METIFKQHIVYNEESLREFFEKPKELQRLAFTGHKEYPVASYRDIVVTDEYAIIESGDITPTRGLHGIFPRRTVNFRWHWSVKSKRCQALPTNMKDFVKGLLQETNKYEFVRLVPVHVLSGTVLRDILLGKITNAKDAIRQYGKRLGVKNLNEEVFKLSTRLGVAPMIVLTAVDLDQLKTCYRDIIDRLDKDGGLGSILGDMFDQAYALEEHINLMWSNSRMNEEHTKWSRRLMRLQVHSKSEEPVWPDSICESFRQHGLELLNTEQRVFEEGYMMQHCVYTNYWPRIKRKDYIVFNMELEDGPVTIGMNRRNDTYEFNQAYHKFDRALSSYEKYRVIDTINQLQVEQLLKAMAYKPIDEEEDSTPIRRRIRRIHRDDWMEFEETNRQLEQQYEEEISLPW